MDQFIFASLSHTHYWYEVGIYNMLKVPYDPLTYYVVPYLFVTTSGMVTVVFFKLQQGPYAECEESINNQIIKKYTVRIVWLNFLSISILCQYCIIEEIRTFPVMTHEAQLCKERWPCDGASPTRAPHNNDILFCLVVCSH